MPREVMGLICGTPLGKSHNLTAGIRIFFKKRFPESLNLNQMFVKIYSPPPPPAPPASVVFCMELIWKFILLVFRTLLANWDLLKVYQLVKVTFVSRFLGEGVLNVGWKCEKTQVFSISKYEKVMDTFLSAYSLWNWDQI